MKAQDFGILHSSDLRQPWQSPFGFPLMAGRLAAGEPILLVCREDEAKVQQAVLDFLLQTPSCLNRAYTMLEHLIQDTSREWFGGSGPIGKPLGAADVPALLTEIEDFLSGVPSQGIGESVAEYVGPSDPPQTSSEQEILLFQLHELKRALEEVKDSGFSIAIWSETRRLVTWSVLQTDFPRMRRACSTPSFKTRGLERHCFQLCMLLIARAD
jgi:hypothetical protein